MPHSNIEPRLRRFARANRAAPTQAEKLAWAYLKSFRELGAKFRREAPIGKFIEGFAWLSRGLVVEVDGASHELPGRAEKDRVREAFLCAEGFEVVRIRDAEVIANDGQAFARIESAVLRRLKTPPLTPPHRGEGKVSAALDAQDPTPTSPHKGEGEAGAALEAQGPSPSPSPQGGRESARRAP
jgi:very-short-patch-repair endonuclease